MSNRGGGDVCPHTISNGDGIGIVIEIATALVMVVVGICFVFEHDI